MTDIVMKHCTNCRKNTKHLRPSTSHVLHLILSLISFGLWIPIWVLVAISNSTQGQCSDCGKSRGFFG